MASFFDKKRKLQCTSVVSSVKNSVASSVADIIAKDCQQDTDYKVVAIMMHRVAFGKLQNNVITLAEGKLEEKFLLELRLFNAEQEIYAIKSENGFDVRNICDNCGEAVEVVDTLSNFFGDNTNKVADGYAELYEEGRKIRMVVPASEKAEHYALKTRSYITYDKDTKQAGFGYYRFLDICAAGKE